jgi:1-acyl-sn-glycerol-3-phosphate acyltransferase
MKTLRALGRLCLVVQHLLGGVFTLWWTFPKLSAAQKEERISAWARMLLARLAIKLVVKGALPQQGPLLLVANHISWLDIIVMHAARYCRFISKADVKHWPVVGTLASGAGTVFIERDSRRDAVRVVHHMAECLQQGDVLAVFPEGTTGDGQTVLPFHANLLQAAIAANAPIQPVALSFVDGPSGALSFAPCYIGDDSLLTSLWRTLCADNVHAVVHYGTPQTADGRDRRAWAHDLRDTIQAMRAPNA